MPLTALGLLLIAGALHTSWNLLVKQAREKQVFTWWALVVGGACLLPLLILSGGLPAVGWPYAIATALVEAAYFWALTYAYETGEFSLVYPIARGTAPALLALWAALFLGERPQPIGLAGLLVLVCGLMIVGGTNLWERRRQASVSTRGLIAALIVACCISTYSAIDGAAMRLVNPLPYLASSTSLIAVFLAPLVLHRYGIRSMAAEWRSQWMRIAAVGILSILTYLLVLQAYGLARISYVGAVREISIVLAALVGWRGLRERFGAVRAGGACLIFGGILVITLSG